jgi:hypothetical protein
MHMRKALAAAAIGFWTLVLSAQDPFTTGSVSGRVLDADTLAALAGVRVGSREIGYVLTDHEGRYRFQGLKPGRLSFSIPSGYMQDPWPSKVVTVIAGREVSSDFRYRLDAQISGRVLDEDGNPVVGAHVMAITRELGPDGELRYEAAGSFYSSATDDRGVYAITTAVRSGRSYWLLAFHLRSFANPISDAPADPSARTRTFAATFHPAADSLSTGAPIVPRSLENPVVDIRMLKKPAYCLEATLMAENKPAQMTFMLSEDIRYAAQFRGVPNRQEGGTSGRDGKIRLCNLPPGQYRLAVISSTTTGLRSPEYFTTVPITIVDRDVLNLSVFALPPATVSGDVAWDGPPSDPALLQTVVRISLDPSPTIPAQPVNVSVPSPFSLAATPGVRYSVGVANSLRGLAPPLYVKDITAGTSSILRKTYMPGGEPLRIRIGHDGGVIRARVANGNGQPSINAAVIVFPANTQSEVELAGSMMEGLTNDDGLFESRTLLPGRYVVMATDDPPPYIATGPAGGLNIQRSPEALARILRARSRGQVVELGPRATIQVHLTPGSLE